MGTYPLIRSQPALSLLPEKRERQGVAASINAELQAVLKRQNIFRTQDNIYRRINERMLQEFMKLEEMGHGLPTSVTENMFMHNGLLDFQEAFDYVEREIRPGLNPEQSASVSTLDEILAAEAGEQTDMMTDYEAARASRTSAGKVAGFVSSLGFGFIEAGTDPVQLALFAGMSAAGGLGVVGRTMAYLALGGASFAEAGRINNRATDALHITHSNLMHNFTSGVITTAALSAGIPLLAITAGKVFGRSGKILRHEMPHPTAADRAVGMATLQETSYKWFHGHDSWMREMAESSAENFYDVLAKGSDFLPYNKYHLDRYKAVFEGQHGYDKDLYARSVLARTKINSIELVTRLTRRAARGEPETNRFWQLVNTELGEQQSFISNDAFATAPFELRRAVNNYLEKPTSANLTVLEKTEGLSDEFTGVIKKERGRLQRVQDLRTEQESELLSQVFDRPVEDIKSSLEKIQGTHQFTASDVRAHTQFLLRLENIAIGYGMELDIAATKYNLSKVDAARLNEFLLVESDRVAPQQQVYHTSLWQPVADLYATLTEKEMQSITLAGQERVVQALMGFGRPHQAISKLVTAIREVTDRQWDTHRLLGVPLRKLDHYVPLAPSRAKIVADTDAFRTFMLKALDWKRVRKLGTEEEFVDGLINSIESFHYQEAGARPLKSQEWARSIFFQDAAGYVQFHERFGKFTNIHDIIKDYAYGSARSLATIDMYGTNTRSGLGLRQLIADRIAKQSNSKVSARVEQIHDYVVLSAWNLDEFGQMGRITQDVSNIAVAGVLAGSGVTAAISDTVATGLASMGLSMGLLRTIGKRLQAVFFGLNKKQMRESLGILEGQHAALSDSAGAGTPNARTRGWIEGMLRYNGTLYVNNAGRAVFGNELMIHLHNLRNTPWPRLSRVLRESMSLSGVTPKHWDRFRVIKPANYNGVPLLSPLKELSKGTRNMPLAMRDTLLAMEVFIRQQIEVAVPSGSPRSATAILGTLKGQRGTFGTAFLGGSVLRLKQAAVSQWLGLYTLTRRSIRARDYGLVFEIFSYNIFAGIAATYLRHLLRGSVPDLEQGDFWQQVFFNPDVIGIFGDVIGNTHNARSFGVGLIGRPATFFFDMKDLTIAGFEAATGTTPDNKKFSRELHKAMRRTLPMRGFPLIGLGLEAAITDNLLRMMDPEAAEYFDGINKRREGRLGTKRVWWGAGQTTPGQE